jgi:NADPH:quinone reductase-like Zn-dependent oxidoreductase
MQDLVIFKTNKKSRSRLIKAGQFFFEGIPVGIGLLESVPPVFDSASLEDREKVLVEVLAFSCNYRDRAILRGYLHNDAAGTPIHIGSDFVGVVREVGRSVKSCAIGDRVVGNNSYPTAAVRWVLPGVATNGASARFLLLHECKLGRIPDSMPLPVAAGFSIAAQTCYSMIRKLSVEAGQRCIVTGASSNTALWAFAILAGMGVETYALTTGSHDFGPLKVAGTIRVKPPFDQSIAANEVAKRIAREHGGADMVIDFFADVYAAHVLQLLKQGGKYITCGIFAQSGIEATSGLSSRNWKDLLMFLIKNNITMYGSCLGTERDLINAIAGYSKLNLSVPVDCVFGLENSVEFVSQSFNETGHLGKVVLQHQPDR